MESNQLAFRPAPADAIALGASCFPREQSSPPCDRSAPAPDSELVLVVSVVRKTPGAEPTACRALYCAPIPAGTALERERLVSAVSGLVRRFAGVAANDSAPPLPPPKWG